jgi:predicted ferric reductase
MGGKTIDNYVSKLVFYGSLLAILGVTIFGWWQSSGSEIATSTDRVIVIARLFGLIASLCVLLEVVLMSRIPIFERNFSLEETVELHKLNGYLLLFMIVGHIVFMTVGYNVHSTSSLWQQFVLLNTGFEDVFKATIGTIMFFCATFLTLGVVRKHLNYELWYLTHLTVYFAILLSFLHTISVGGDIVHHTWFKVFWLALFALVFGMLAYYRFAKMFIQAWQYDFRVLKIEREAEDTYSIYITGNNVQNFEFIPGQYASWRFLHKSSWFEAHPFSFSLEPGYDVLRITAKTKGDFSNKLLSLKPGTRVLVDGPRGAFTSNFAKTKSTVLIAGGIGVAPFMSKIPVLAGGQSLSQLSRMQSPRAAAELQASHYK